MQYIPALLHYIFSHIEVSIGPHCSGITMQEWRFVSLLVSFTPMCSTWFDCCYHQWLIWLLHLSSWEPKCILLSAKGTFKSVLLPQDNQGQQKGFWGEMGALILSCHSKGQQCSCAQMEVGVPGHSNYFSHIVARPRYDYSLTNILCLLA